MPHAPKFQSILQGTKSVLSSMEDERMGQLRVLVADPYAQLREILRDILLRGIGVEEVIEAKNGEEALAMVHDLGCDVAIFDCAMRPMGGIELTKRIRKGIDGVDPFLPVILVSGHAEISQIIEARDAGANEYLAKPLSAKILELRLNAVIMRPRPFVRSDKFFGPDRRRHAKYGFQGSDRRNLEPDTIDPNNP